MTPKTISTVLLSLLLPAALCAQAMPGMDMGHHEEAPFSTEKLGEVHFPVSCKPTTQAPFARGVALLLIDRQRILQVAHDARVVERMDVAGDAQRQRAHRGARGRIRRQQRRRRMRLIQVFDDRQRLG